MAKGHGGRRAGAGRKKGSRNPNAGRKKGSLNTLTLRLHAEQIRTGEQPKDLLRRVGTTGRIGRYTLTVPQRIRLLAAAAPYFAPRLRTVVRVPVNAVGELL